MSGELGYEEALEEVKKIRMQRKKEYGDSWQDMEPWELLAFIKEKTRRAVMSWKKGNTERLKDSLIDLTNYSLFLLQNLKRKVKKKKDQEVSEWT